MSPQSFASPNRVAASGRTSSNNPSVNGTTADIASRDSRGASSQSDPGTRSALDTRGSSDSTRDGRGDRSSRSQKSLSETSRDRADTREARALADVFDDFDDAFDDLEDDFDDFYDDLEDDWGDYYGDLYGYYSPWYGAFDYGYHSLFSYGYHGLYQYHHPFFYRYDWYHYWYGYYPIYDQYAYPQYVSYAPQPAASDPEVIVYYPTYEDADSVPPQPETTSHIPTALAKDLESLGKNDNAVELLEQGARLLKSGDYAGSADSLRRSMLAEPGSAVPKFALAHALFALGDYDYAAFLIRRGMNLLPEWPRVGTSLHELYGDPNDLEEHIVALNVYVNTHPSAVEARFLLGYVSYFAANLDAAEAAFKDADSLRAGQVEVAAFLSRIAEIRVELAKPETGSATPADEAAPESDAPPASEAAPSDHTAHDHGTSGG